MKPKEPEPASDTICYPIGELMHHIEREVAEWIREAKAHAWNECNDRWAARGLTPDQRQANPYSGDGVMRPDWTPITCPRCETDHRHGLVDGGCTGCGQVLEP